MLALPTLTRIALLCGGLIAVAAVTLAQPPAPPKAAPSQSDMKKMFNDNTARARLPAPAHEALSQLVGEFTTVSEVHLAPPPAEPMKAHATTIGTWSMGELFVQTSAASDPDEELKRERLVIYGFDPQTAKYTMWQIESGNLTATSAIGDYDAPTRTFTFEGERELGPRGKAAILWTISVQTDGTLKQSIKLKAPGAEKFNEFVNVTHTRKPVK